MLDSIYDEVVSLPIPKQDELLQQLFSRVWIGRITARRDALAASNEAEKAELNMRNIMDSLPKVVEEKLSKIHNQ